MLKFEIILQELVKLLDYEIASIFLKHQSFRKIGEEKDEFYYHALRLYLVFRCKDIVNNTSWEAEFSYCRTISF